MRNPTFCGMCKGAAFFPHANKTASCSSSFAHTAPLGSPSPPFVEEEEEEEEEEENIPPTRIFFNVLDASRSRQPNKSM
jgi:hypothetical protein